MRDIRRAHQGPGSTQWRWQARCIWLAAMHMLVGVIATTAWATAAAVEPSAAAPTAVVLRRSLVAGGGDESAVGTLQLRGSIGQAIAGSEPSGAAALALQSGFWTAAHPPPQPLIFVDGFE